MISSAQQLRCFSAMQVLAISMLGASTPQVTYPMRSSQFVRRQACFRTDSHLARICISQSYFLCACSTLPWAAASCFGRNTGSLSNKFRCPDSVQLLPKTHETVSLVLACLKTNMHHHIRGTLHEVLKTLCVVCRHGCHHRHNHAAVQLWGPHRRIEHCVWCVLSPVTRPCSVWTCQHLLSTSVLLSWKEQMWRPVCATCRRDLCTAEVLPATEVRHPDHLCGHL